MPSRLRDAANRLSRIPWIPIAVWAVLYLPRPLRIGFYGDDWMAIVQPAYLTPPFSPARFHHFFGLDTPYAARPVAGWIEFVISSVCGTSPFAHQLIATFICLAVALSFRSWTTAQFTDVPRRGALAADFAAAFWLASPWMLGITGWVTCTPHLLTQLCLTELGRRFLTEQSFSRRRLTAYAAALAASGLIYEILYFQIFLIIGFYILCQRPRFPLRQKALPVFIACLAGQIFSVIANRSIAAANPVGVGMKHFRSDWHRPLLLSLRTLPELLTATLGANSTLWWNAVTVLATVATLMLFVGLFRRDHRAHAARAAGLLLLGAAATVLSAATLSVAGFNFQASALETRTMFGPSWGMAIAFYALASMVLLWDAPLFRWLLSAIGAVMLTVMGQAHLENIAEFSYAWQRQKEVLANIPAGELLRLPRGAAIFYTGPSYFHRIPIFAAGFDIGPAVASRLPLLDAQPFDRRMAFYSATDIYHWSWNGVILKLDFPGFWSAEYPVKRLYIWNWPSRTIEEAHAGFRWNPGESWQATVAPPAP